MAEVLQVSHRVGRRQVQKTGTGEGIEHPTIKDRAGEINFTRPINQISVQKSTPAFRTTLPFPYL